jgi:hypothetical protein
MELQLGNVLTGFAGGAGEKEHQSRIKQFAS